MEDERITLRMGQDDVRTMDEYLEGHPELGSRSLFIRTAVREYINRDAGVSAAQGSPRGIGAERDVRVTFPDGSEDVTVHLSKRYVDAMGVEAGEKGLATIGELMRNILWEHYTTPESRKKTATESFERANPAYER